MTDLDRIEELRDLTAGMEYDTLIGDEEGLDPDRLDDIAAYGYDLDDPKGPWHYDVYADVWDAREGK